MDINHLEKEFGISGQLEFVEGPGNHILIHIKNEYANAIISTYAGQILSYRPVSQNSDMLFLSEAAYFRDGKAIKGGTPVCWPWFGADPENKGRAAHGFVRNRQWQVTGTQTLDDGSTRIVLGIDSNNETLAIWPHAFELSIQFTLGASLEISLATTNRDSQPVEITQALHTYFKVGDISKTQLLGLEGKSYIDTLDNNQTKTQQGLVEFVAETDRIYTDVDSDIILNDPVLERNIKIASTGSKSAVVWNPWVEKSASMDDFLDEEYKIMLCVETTNAGPDTVDLAPGDTYVLKARYTVS